MTPVREQVGHALADTSLSVLEPRGYFTSNQLERSRELDSQCSDFRKSVEASEGSEDGGL